MENLVFEDLEPVSITVKINKVDYTLREPTADASAKYQNACTKGSTMQDGRIRMGDPADAEPLLVSLCLFDAKGSSVPLNVVRGWPSRIVGRLYDKVKEMGRIGLPSTLEEVDAQIATLQRERERLCSDPTPVT